MEISGTSGTSVHTHASDAQGGQLSGLSAAAVAPLAIGVKLIIQFDIPASGGALQTYTVPAGQKLRVISYEGWSNGTGAACRFRRNATNQIFGNVNWTAAGNVMRPASATVAEQTCVAGDTIDADSTGTGSGTIFLEVMTIP